MSETIVFNTEDTLKDNNYATTYNIPLFDLVPDTDPILRQVLPEFDFKNPPVNAIEFASSLVETCKKHNG